MLTTVKVATGEFEVFWNGKKTSYRIVNGSRGLSGKDTRNVYGICKTDASVKWIGPLASAKKILELTFTKKRS